MTIGDVAIGQVGRRDQRLVGDGDTMVGLVTIAQALEDLDGVGHRGLFHLDGLESPLQRGVFLQVFAVFVERGGTDRLQLAAGQHRLEDRRCVDGSFGSSGADEGVQLVDEQDDVAAGLDLFENLLEPFLEITAVARTRHQRTEIEGVQLLAGQRLRHGVLGDGLSQALDDGGLADARFADEHRVVLGAAGQNLHHPFRLPLAADDRIETVVAGELREVATELVQHKRTGRLGLRRRGARRAAGLLGLTRTGVARQQLDDLLADPGKVCAQLHEHLGGHPFALTDEAEENVLGADVVVTELQRLAQRQLQNLLRARREGDVTGRRRAALTDDLLYLMAYRLEGDAERLEGFGRHPLALMNKPEQNVLGADVVVVQQPRFFLRQDDDATCSVGEPFEQGPASHEGVVGGEPQSIRASPLRTIGSP